MKYQRRRMLAVLAALPWNPAIPGAPVLEAKTTIPLDPPVSQPPPTEIQRLEDLIKAALHDTSEDKSLTVDQIRQTQPDLRSASDTNIDLAVRDLLWRRDIEEVDDQQPSVFRLVRSSAG